MKNLLCLIAFALVGGCGDMESEDFNLQTTELDLPSGPSVHISGEIYAVAHGTTLSVYEHTDLLRTVAINGNPVRLLLVELGQGEAFFVGTDHGLQVFDLNLSELTAQVGLSNVQRSIGSLSVVDIDGDGLRDVYIGHADSFAELVQCGGVSCDIDSPNAAYRGTAEGRFVEVPDAFGAPNRGATLGQVFGDIDGDGDLDLYLANDFGQDEMYENVAGTLVCRTEHAGILGNSNSMGVVIGDIDDDGLQDLYVTRYGTDAFWQQTTPWQFENVSTSFGLEEGFGQERIGWDVELIRFEGDASPSVVIAEGWWDIRARTPHTPQSGVRVLTPENGTFVERVFGEPGLGAWWLSVDSVNGEVLVTSPFRPPVLLR